MKWQQVKTLVKKILFTFIFILTILIFLTIFINTIIPKKQIKSLIIKYGKIYTGRDIDINNISINIFKGIVAEKIEIAPFTDITNSAKIDIQELQLRYNWKDLLKFKINIEKLVIKGIEFRLERKSLNSEISYYKNKFKPKKVSYKRKSKIKFKIREIETIDDNILLIILKDNKSINIKIKNGIIKFGRQGGIKIIETSDIIYKNINASVIGNLLFVSNRISGKFDIKTSDKNILMTTLFLSTNKKEFFTKNRVKYLSHNINAQGFLTFSTNRLILRQFNMSDMNIIYMKIPNGFINTKSQNIFFDAVVNFKDLKPDLFTFIKNVDFKINGDTKLNLRSNLKNIQRLIVSGELNLIDSYINFGNRKLSIKSFAGTLKNNILTSKANLKYANDSNMDIVLNKKDIFNNKVPLLINGKIDRIDLNNVSTNIKTKFVPSNIRFDLVYNIFEKKITFKKCKFNINTSIIDANGDYHLKKEIPNIFNLKLRNFSLKNIITNKVGGIVSADSSLSFSISKENKFIINYLNGTLNGPVTYDDISTHVVVPFEMKKQIFQSDKIKISVGKNIITGDAQYNLNLKNIYFKGNSTKFDITELKIPNIFGKIDFDIEFRETLKDDKKPELNLSLSAARLKYMKLNFNDIKGSMSLKDNKVKSTLLTKAYNGNINISADGNLDIIGITGQGTNLKVKGIMKDLVDEDISGTMNFKLNGTYSSKKHKFENTLNARIIRGEIKNTKFQKNMSGFVGLLPLQDVFYKEIDANIRFVNKQIYFEKVNIIGFDQHHIVNGFYNIADKTFDIKIKSRFNEEFVMNIPNFGLPILEHKNGWYYIKKLNYNKSQGEKPQFFWSVK